MEEEEKKKICPQVRQSSRLTLEDVSRQLLTTLSMLGTSRISSGLATSTPSGNAKQETMIGE